MHTSYRLIVPVAVRMPDHNILAHGAENSCADPSNTTTLSHMERILQVLRLKVAHSKTQSHPMCNSGRYGKLRPFPMDLRRTAILCTFAAQYYTRADSHAFRRCTL